MRLLSLLAGVLLRAAVRFVIRDLSRPHPHEPRGGGGATSGDSNGNSSSPVTITVPLGTSPSANVSVTAKLDGVVLASGGTSGPMAT